LEAPAILRAEEISQSYGARVPRGSRPQPVLREIRFSLHPGECVALIGASGSGKTTLGRILSGLLRPDAGRVLFAGRPMWDRGGCSAERPRQAVREFRRRVRHILQGARGSLNPGMRVREILAEPVRAHEGASARRAAPRVDAVAHAVGLGARHLESYPGALSGGECRRVALGRALAVPPEVLIADEMFTGLDFWAAQPIAALLRTLAVTQRLGILLITHDLEDVRMLADRVFLLRRGEPLAPLAASEMRALPQAPEGQR